MVVADMVPRGSRFLDGGLSEVLRLESASNSEGGRNGETFRGEGAFQVA